MLTMALLLLLLIAVASISIRASAAAFKATDLILFDCGATSSNTPDQSGRVWSVEDRRVLSENSNGSSFSATASVQDSSVDQVPYMTARIFRSDFSYGFTVSPGWKFVRLYFYPTLYGSDFDAVNSSFAVTANGFSLMRNFSASLTAAGSDPPSKSLIKEFIVPVLDDQTLNLTFTPSVNSLAFVNGVEIVSIPDELYTKGGFDGLITNVDSSVIFEINNSTAFETVYRVNVGGKPIGAVNDTGMFRRWDSEEDYLLGVSGQTPNPANVRINYTSKTPAYVAPEDVYTTYRTMGNAENPFLNLNFNLTWHFVVDVGFSYLVRLHFCETMQEVTKPGQRIFSIFIANRMAVPDADVIRWGGGSKIPVYKDFFTFMNSNGGDTRRTLSLDLHPFNEVKPQYLDAILNGVEILKLNNTEGSLAGPNPDPVPSSEPESKSSSRGRGKERSKVMVIVLAVVGCAIGLLTITVVAVLFIRLRKKRQRKTTDYSRYTTSKPKDSWGPFSYNTLSTTTKSTSTLPSDLCHRFSIAEIRSATANFDEELIVGVGGFGNVYKGRIDGISTMVAIKRLGTSSHQGVTEFETELKLLSKLRHVHLVSLIGYCDDESEMILVYDYMPRGTLKGLLYKKDKNNEPALTWKQRLEICIGAARGIQYLHTGAKHPIIHRDIKSTNILLDGNYVAKVSDFGLSKVGPTSVSQTHVTTFVKGSVGYLDPEYYRRQLLTEKSDVYSFGVVLFEVLCGRPVRIPGLDTDQVDLTRWAKLNHSRNTIDQIVDPHLTADITRVSLDKFCEIAVRCVHERGTERPTMNDVVWALEFALQLHETTRTNDDVDDMNLIKTEETNQISPHGYNTGDYSFSTTTGHVSEFTSMDESNLVNFERTTGSSSEAGFSEIKKPQGP